MKISGSSSKAKFAMQPWRRNILSRYFNTPMEGQPIFSAKKHSQASRSKSAENTTAKKTGVPGKGSKFEKDFDNYYIKGGQQQYKPNIPIVTTKRTNATATSTYIPGRQGTYNGSYQNQMPIVAPDYETEPYSMPLTISQNRGRFSDSPGNTTGLPIVGRDASGQYEIPMVVEPRSSIDTRQMQDNSEPMPVIARDASGQYDVPIIIDARSSEEPRQMQAQKDSYQGYGEDEMYLED